MSVSLVEKIITRARDEEAPSGGTYRALSLAAVAGLSRETGVSRRDIEIAALEKDIVPVRYARNIGSLGIEGQLALRRACVGVIGVGGLGGTAIELLARLGIGSMVVVDGDSFTEDNLNRQVLSTERSVGMSKVEAAAERVASVNSAVEIEARLAFIDRDNVDSFIGACDLVIDALDSITARLVLEGATRRRGIPLVHGAIAGFAGELMTIYPGDRGLTAVFGTAKVPEKGIELELGAPTVTPAVVAAYQVMEAVKIVTGRGTTVRGRLLFFDLEDGGTADLRLSNAG